MSSTLQHHSLVEVEYEHALTNMLCYLKSCNCTNDLPIFVLLTDFLKNNRIYSSGILRTVPGKFLGIETVKILVILNPTGGYMLTSSSFDAFIRLKCIP